MLVNHLQTAILKLLGGPWLWLGGPSGHYVGPHGCSSTSIVTKRSPKPILGATGFRRKWKREKLSSVTKQPKHQQFFWLSGGPWHGLHRPSGHYVGPLHATNTLANVGALSWDLGPPPWVRASIYKKNNLQDPCPNTHTAATIRKEVLTPPQPLPTRKRAPRCRGVRGSKSKKSLEDHVWS